MSSRWFRGSRDAGWIPGFLLELQAQQGRKTPAANLAGIARSAVYRMLSKDPAFGFFCGLASQQGLTPELAKRWLNWGQTGPVDPAASQSATRPLSSTGSFFVLPTAQAGDVADSVKLSVDGRVVTISADVLAALASQMGGGR